MRLGATGNFPQGKINDDDEGELRIAIGTKKETIIIDFGKSIFWLGFGKQQAIDFANTIIRHAERI